MLRIRLRKTGRKKVNSFRIVAIDNKKPRDSLREKYNLGYYLPQNKQKYLSININIINTLIKHGGQPSQRVKKLIKIAENNAEYRREK